MNIAFTESCGQKFDLLTRNFHDIIIWEVNETFVKIYTTNMKASEKLVNISKMLKLKISSDKFANTEAYHSIYGYEGLTDVVCDFLKNHFNAGIEKIPKYVF